MKKFFSGGGSSTAVHHHLVLQPQHRLPHYCRILYLLIITRMIDIRREIIIVLNILLLLEKSVFKKLFNEKKILIIKFLFYFFRKYLNWSPFQTAVKAQSNRQWHHLIRNQHQCPSHHKLVVIIYSCPCLRLYFPPRLGT